MPTIADHWIMLKKTIYFTDIPMEMVVFLPIPTLTWLHTVLSVEGCSYERINLDMIQNSPCQPTKIIIKTDNGNQRNCSWTENIF